MEDVEFSNEHRGQLASFSEIPRSELKPHPNIATDYVVVSESYGLFDDAPEFEVLSPSEKEMLVRGTVNLINIVLDGKADVMFFLDKSARPAAHLFHKTWQALFDEPGPEIKFINIGRNQQITTTPLTIDQTTRIMQHYGDLNERNIVICDEYCDTGNTLTTAKKVFEQIYPDAQKAFTSVYENSPSWEGDVTKIGVMDPDDKEYEEAHPLIVMRWKPEEDVSTSKAIQLRRELTVLADYTKTIVYGVTRGEKHIQTNVPEIIRNRFE